MHGNHQNSRALFTIQLESHTKSIGTFVRVQFDTSNITKFLKESIIATKEVGVGKMEGVSGHLAEEHNEKDYERGQIDVNHNVPKRNHNRTCALVLLVFCSQKDHRSYFRPEDMPFGNLLAVGTFFLRRLAGLLLMAVIKLLLPVINYYV